MARHLRNVKYLCQQLSSSRNQEKQIDIKRIKKNHFLCHDPIISEAIFPVHAVVKPMLEDRVDLKASMPDYQYMETIAAILT